MASNLKSDPEKVSAFFNLIDQSLSQIRTLIYELEQEALYAPKTYLEAVDLSTEVVPFVNALREAKKQGEATASLRSVFKTAKKR